MGGWVSRSIDVVAQLTCGDGYTVIHRQEVRAGL